MTRAELASEIARLLAGTGGLLTGLFLLTAMPLTAVLTILGAMGLTLSSMARLCGAGMCDVHRGGYEQKPPRASMERGGR